MKTLLLLILTACAFDSFSGTDGAVVPDAPATPPDAPQTNDGTLDGPAAQPDAENDAATDLDASLDDSAADASYASDAADAPNDGAPWNAPWYVTQCNYKDAGTSCDGYHDWLCRKTCSSLSKPNCACVTNSYCYCP